jgi:RimJ/RimL family protein N-acetyltransferase
LSDVIGDDEVELEDGVVRLRPLQPSDAGAWLAGEDDEIRRWFQLPRASTLPDVEATIEAFGRSWREGGRVRQFGVWAVESGTLVGGVELRERGEDAAYLSYQVFAPHRRKGYATRAVRLAVIHAEQALPVERLVIITDVDNVAAQGVALAAEFRLDGPADPHEHIELGNMLRFVRP